MEFTTTARGATGLDLNRFKYWRCAVNRKCGGSVTAEDGVLLRELLRENAVHTHPPIAKCKLRWIEWCKRFGYVGKVTQKCRQSETYAPK